jgi:hypothetical protein
MALPAGRKGVLASELTPDGRIKGGGGGGGGSTLYRHKILIKTGSMETGYEIINNSETPFTRATFLEYYRNIGSETMLFHHIQVISSTLWIYVIDCTAGIESPVKVFLSDGTVSSSGIQTFNDTVTAL